MNNQINSTVDEFELISFVKTMSEHTRQLLIKDFNTEQYIHIYNEEVSEKDSTNIHGVNINQEDTRITYIKQASTAYDILQEIIEDRYPLINYTKELKKKLNEAIPKGRLVYNSGRKERTFKVGSKTMFNSCFLPEHFYIKQTNKHDVSHFVKKILPKHKEFHFLLTNLFKEDKNIEWFVNWLCSAFLGRKNLSAAILTGVEGSGKGVLMSFVEYFFGQSNVLTASNELLTSQFNEQMEDRMFVNLNEITLNKNRELYEKLKTWITDPTFNLNAKSIKNRTKANNMNFLITTNNATPIEVSMSDRRYSIFETKSVNLKNVVNQKWFKDFREDFDNIIMSLKDIEIDFNRADYAVLNDKKKFIAQSTTTKKELLLRLIKTCDIKELEAFEEIFLDNNYTDQHTNKMNYEKLLSDIDLFNTIDNTIAEWAYRVFANEKEATTTIGIYFTNQLNSKPKQKQLLVDGKPVIVNGRPKMVRYRKIENPEDKKD